MNVFAKKDPRLRIVLNSKKYFSPLMGEMDCFICNNFFHKEIDYTSSFTSPPKQ